MIIRYLHFPIVIFLYPLLTPSPLLISTMALFKILVSSVGAIVGFLLAEYIVKGRDMRTNEAKKAVGARCIIALIVALLVSIAMLVIVPMIRESPVELPAYFAMLLLGAVSLALSYELFQRRGR